MNNSIVLVFIFIPVFLLATSFTRIYIILSFLRKGLGEIGVPSGQILFGIALLFSIIVMRDPLQEIYTKSFIPYTEGKKSVQQLLSDSEVPLRTFMLGQVTESDLEFVKKQAQVSNSQETPFMILLGSFALSELKKGLLMGFLLWIPFLLIDLVCSTFVSAVGIHSLSTSMISLPLKILLFLAADGWRLIFGSITESYLVR